ncbi:hypothetical protein [Thauera phenylacetica]|jgi:hypothetical protein|uniref:hypothetical protein n=1 Tax=Thauera phenylacetica TaxID=164400 RepID=UPI0039E4F51F
MSAPLSFLRRPPAPPPTGAGATSPPALAALPASGVAIAVAMVRPRALERLCAEAPARAAFWSATLRDPALADWLAPLRPTRLHVGSEFCERLLPEPEQLERTLAEASAAGLEVCLLTPVASPEVLRALDALFALLPAGAEVVVNDWGVALRLRERHPLLQAVAGRILCRMLKDPRLGNPQYAPPAAHGFASPWQQRLFARVGITRVEMDLPLFADADSFSGVPLPLGVHLPFAFVAKGRMCRTAGLARPGPERFAPQPFCHHECLGLAARTERERAGTQDAWETVHVGNTVFCRHSAASLAVLAAAVAAGRVARLIVPGEAL